MLRLNANRLEGEIPSLSALAKLMELGLNTNRLTGGLPSRLGVLTELTVLNLALNGQLTGPIPAEMEKLVKLQALYLQVNQLNGTVPSWIDSLTNLQELILAYNAFCWGDTIGTGQPCQPA